MMHISNHRIVGNGWYWLVISIVFILDGKSDNVARACEGTKGLLGEKNLTVTAQITEIAS